MTKRSNTRVAKIVLPTKGWPKHQVLARFNEKGEQSARRLAKRLDIAPSRVNGWLTRGFYKAA